MTSTLVGLDFGASSVRAVEVRNSRGGATIVRSHSEAIPPGAVRAGEIVERANVTTALRKLWSVGKFGSKDVVIGVGGPKVFAREIDLPDGPLGQIRESLPFLVQDQLPMPAAEALMDFYPLSRDAGNGSPVINGLLVAAPHDAVLANVEATLAAGLRPVRVDLIPFALSRVFTPIAPAETATVLISVGAWSTHVVISVGGLPQYVRMIGSGGEDLTQGISTRLAIPPAQAEGLKRQFGLVRGTARAEDRPIVEAVYGAAWEFVSSIRDTLDFYVAGRRATPLGQIVFTGGGSNLPGIQDALGELIGLPVVTNDPFSAATVAKPIRRLPREARDSYATAFGLALGVSA